MIGKILKTMRREKGLSQMELSDIVFLGRSTLSDYEREKTDISFDNIEKIAEACDYEVVFINKKDGSRKLTSNNIDREEI